MAGYLIQYRFRSNTYWLLVLFLITSFFVLAQNNTIIISDSLTVAAEKYNIRNVKLKKFKFGEYAVVKAKAPWITSTAHTTYKTYEEDIARQKFSFILTNNKSDSAQVKALITEITQYRQSGGFLLEATTGIESANYEGLNNPSNLSASISINNKTEPWHLLLEETPIMNDGKNMIKGTLSNGLRIIDIVQVYFDKEGTYNIDATSSYPPIRYEFIENGISLGAIRREYGSNPYFLFKFNLEPTMKLILAATMISIMETEYIYRFQVTRE